MAIEFFDMTNEEGYEYTRIPKNIADLLTKAASRKEQEDIFFKAIADRKRDVKNDIEALDDDLLLFKAFGVKYQNELEKIYNDQYSKFEAVWEKLNASDMVYGKLKELESKTKQFKQDIESINNSIDHVSLYKIEKVIEIVDKFNRMSEDDKGIIKYLLEQKSV